MSQPRFIPVADIFEMHDGTPVEAVKGKIKGMFEYKSGVKNKKPWSFQNLTITDGTTDIKVTLCGRPELEASFKGKQVCILSHFGDHGMTGIKAKDDSYEKDGETVTNRILWVTGSAEITSSLPAGEIGKESSTDKPPANKPAGKAAAAPKQTAGGSSQQSDDKAPQSGQRQPAAGANIPEAKRALMRIANLKLLTLDCAVYVAKEFAARHPEQPLMTREDVLSISAGMAIDARYAGVQNLMPTDPLPRPEKPSASDAAKK
jgi:hypothetical protein